MESRPKNVAVLGSTGSIGRNALEVIAASGGKLRAAALSAHTNAALLAHQARQFRPKWIALSDSATAETADLANLPKPIEVIAGPQALEQIAAEPTIDVVLTAIVGSAGLRGTFAALEAGTRVALANKETMVVAGPLVRNLASRRGAQIVPVDSEHSAIFQCLQAGRREEVKRIVLTASGGPFRNHSLDQMARVTVDQALRHPTWTMGAKITVDSATMMNKALEIVEARWLFDLEVDQISVVVHPQSVIHSFVEFVDGSVLAQLSPPDMKLPIQYALSFPSRLSCPAAKIDWSAPQQLEFEPPDLDRFPAIGLGMEVARAGGTAGAVVNAANEAAVGSFLAGEMSFGEIVPTCRRILEAHEHDSHPSLDQLLRLDRWAREEVSRCLCH
jgi:1-deoxy-D-xylulose-5-phosphate reductoisomerase